MIKLLSDKLVKACAVIALAGLTTVAEAQTYNWSSAGPIYTAGRARNMIIDKSDVNNNTLYVGSASSGIFKSVNAGLEWTPLNDQGTIRNISYLAQAADNVIYVGTGEGFLRSSQKAKALPGTGLYKLAGNSIVAVTSSSITGTVINKVACHPSQAGQIALATNKGILVSTNYGVSFSNAVGTPTDATGLDIKFDNNGILYCSAGSELSTGPQGAIASSVWKANSADLGSAVFTNITPTSIAVPNSNYGRIELAISPTNPLVVYASCAGKAGASSPVSSSTLAGLFVSYDGGANWGTILVGSAQLDPLFNGTTRASGDYAHCITVSPTNPDEIILGGYYLYTFTRTGGTNSSPVGIWDSKGSAGALNTQVYLHENIHDVKVLGSKVYVVTDAGIYRTIDNFLTFQPFYKGLVTGQFNSVSIERYPLAANANSGVSGTTITPYIGYIGGTGGNGLVYFRGTYSNVTKEVPSFGGDIYNAEFSKILPNAAYFTTSSGSLLRNTDVKESEPTQVDLVLNNASQNIVPFSNTSFSVSGTPFKLWEYYGQLYKGQTLRSPDSLVFYNDSSFALASIPSLTASTEFTFTIGRPQPKAIIDHITIRATTVKVAITPSAVAIANYSVVNTKTLEIQCSSTFTLPAPGTASNPGTATVPIVSVDGYTNATPLTSTKLKVNSYTNLEELQVSLAAPLFSTYPTSVPASTNIETYTRLKATVYYRYRANDSIFILDDNISTLGTTYSVTTKKAMSWTLPATSTLNATSNELQRFPLKRSARLAVALGGGGIFVSKAPLDMNTPLSFVKVSANKALTTDANGNPLSGLNNTVSVTGKPTLIEWSKSGTELYYATDANNLYRVSHIYDILDSTTKSYSGKLQTGIFTYSNTPAPPQYTATAFNTPNPNCPYRTTFLGNFPNKITSISVASNDSIVTLTFDDATATGTLVMSNTVDIRKCDNTNVGFTNKTGSGLGTSQIYCSLMEKSNYKKVFVGTDNGIFTTNDISAPTPSWVPANNNQLPSVQIFDIKQQTMNSWECYNSGQIYVATNGRGVWTNSEFYTPSVVSVEEIVKSGSVNNLSLYPNPTSGEVYVSFKGFDGETVSINVMDINGKLVKTEFIGKLSAGEVNYSFETSSLSTGVYIVNVTGDSGIRRVSKLIVTK